MKIEMKAYLERVQQVVDFCRDHNWTIARDAKSHNYHVLKRINDADAEIGYGPSVNDFKDAITAHMLGLMEKSPEQWLADSAAPEALIRKTLFETLNRGFRQYMGDSNVIRYWRQSLRSEGQRMLVLQEVHLDTGVTHMLGSTLQVVSILGLDNPMFLDPAKTLQEIYEQCDTLDTEIVTAFNAITKPWREESGV